MSLAAVGMLILSRLTVMSNLLPSSTAHPNRRLNTSLCSWSARSRRLRESCAAMPSGANRAALESADDET